MCAMNLLGNHTGHNNFTLTEQGRLCSKQVITLVNPKPLMTFVRDSSDDPQSCTTLELIMKLQNRGWVEQVKNSEERERVYPFTLSSPKMWYRKMGKKLSKLYLGALLQTSTLFASGTLTKLYHFQSQNYYRAVLEGFDPLPNQPLVYYKHLMSGGDGGSAEIKTVKPKQTNCATGGFVDDELGILFVIFPTAVDFGKLSVSGLTLLCLSISLICRWLRSL